MVTGFVKFFDNKKGFGFIKTDKGEDLFVHFSSIISDEEYKRLDEGDRVSFTREESSKGPSAIISIKNRSANDSRFHECMWDY